MNFIFINLPISSLAPPRQFMHYAQFVVQLEPKKFHNIDFHTFTFK